MAEITTTERLPFPLAKPNPDTFVTQTDQIGHKGGSLADVLENGGTTSEILSSLSIFPTSTKALSKSLTGKALRENGTSYDNASAVIKIYSVSEGELLDVFFNKDFEGVYQFQTSDAVPSSNNTNIVGSTITQATSGIILVPENALYLVVSLSSSNAVNYVKHVDNTIATMPEPNKSNPITSGGVWAYNKAIILSVLQANSTTSALNSGEYGYNVSSNSLVYKISSGSTVNIPLSKDVLYIYKGQAFYYDGTALKPYVAYRTIVVKGKGGVPQVNDPEADSFYTNADCSILYFVGHQQAKTHFLSAPVEDSTIIVFENEIIKSNTRVNISPEEVDDKIASPFNMEIVPLSVIQANSTSSALSDGEYGYNISSKNILYKNGSTIETIIKKKEAIYIYRGYEFLFDGEKLVPNTANRVFKVAGMGGVPQVNAPIANSFYTNAACTTLYFVGNDANKSYYLSATLDSSAVVIFENKVYNGGVRINYTDTEVNNLVNQSVQKCIINLSAIRQSGTSSALSNGEYGYNISSKSVVYKDANGTVTSESVNSYTWYRYKGWLFVANGENLCPDVKNRVVSVKMLSLPTVHAELLEVDSFYSNGKNTLYFIGDPVSSTHRLSTTIDETTIIECNGIMYQYNSTADKLLPINPLKGYLPYIANFAVDDNLHDYESEVQYFTPYDGSTVFNNLYSKIDALASQYPDIITKVDLMEYLSDEMQEMGVTDYPRYANGISSGDLEYDETPAYKTYMYIVEYGQNNWGSSGSHQHKNVLLVCGTHGGELMAQINSYLFIKELCEGTADKNYFELRNSCKFFIVPMLCGYGTYHQLRTNANGVNINRNYPRRYNDFVVSGEGTGEYTGSAAFSEFESKLVKCLTEKITPEVAIDHHNYNNNPYQIFYGTICSQEMARCLYNSAIDISHTLQKKYPEDFGENGKLLAGTTSLLTYQGSSTVNASQVTSTYWYNIANVKYAMTVEVSMNINYNQGEIDTSLKSGRMNDVYSIAQYTLLVSLIRSLQQLFRFDLDA